MNSTSGVIRPGKSIPTEFRGIKFRSRLEANVAQFLLDIGLEYEYEAKSFLVDGEHYCPDFYIPCMQQFIEVRGYESEASERTLDFFSRSEEGTGLVVFYSDRVVTKGTYGDIGTEVVFCNWDHATVGTLYGPVYGCWLCKQLRITPPRGAGRVTVDVVMRGYKPVLITDLGMSIQGIGRVE